MVKMSEWMDGISTSMSAKISRMNPITDTRLSSTLIK